MRNTRTPTPVCASAHGTILKADHPWWKTHIPPLHFNCRSTIVPMTEAAAQEAGITEHPTDLSSSLGFGNPPYGVPAAARDLPTEEQREKERQASRKAQEAIEQRNNASAMHAMDAKAVTKAKNELKEAERRLVSAPPEKRSEAEEDVRRKSEAKDKAVTQERKSASLVERCWRKAEKLSRELKSSSWSLVKGRLGRLKVGVSRGAAEILGELLDAMDEIPLGQEAQAFAFAGDGGGSFGRDFLARRKLLGNGFSRETRGGSSSSEKNPTPVDLDTIDAKKAASRFFGGNRVVAGWWKELRSVASQKIKNSVDFYKGKSFRELNKRLRENIGLSSIQSFNKKILAEMLSSQKAPEDLVLHRGAGGLSVLKSMFPGIVPNEETPDGWRNAIKKRIIKENHVITHDKAFMSTSLSADRALKSDVYISINVHKGQKGMAPIVGSDNRYQHQQEILIEPGRTLSCTSVEVDNRGGLHITCELLPREDEI